MTPEQKKRYEVLFSMGGSGTNLGTQSKHMEKISIIELSSYSFLRISLDNASFFFKQSSPISTMKTYHDQFLTFGF